MRALHEPFCRRRSTTSQIVQVKDSQGKSSRMLRSLFLSQLLPPHHVRVCKGYSSMFSKFCSNSAAPCILYSFEASALHPSAKQHQALTCPLNPPTSGTLYLRWTPHPVIVTIRDNRDVFGSSYTLIIPLLQGGGPPHLYPGYTTNRSYIYVHSTSFLGTLIYPAASYPVAFRWVVPP